MKTTFFSLHPVSFQATLSATAATALSSYLDLASNLRGRCVCVCVCVLGTFFRSLQGLVAYEPSCTRLSYLFFLLSICSVVHATDGGGSEFF
ncbi:hypothetical protein BX666DRAFT_1986090, partial [Dichotomocladium elegans]